MAKVETWMKARAMPVGDMSRHPLRQPSKGGRGCLSPRCLESQGCHLIPLCSLLSCSSAQSCYPVCLIFFCLLVLSSELFPRNSSIFFIKRQVFCMTPVQQLGEVSWWVVCAACCHMALVFAVMHLHNILKFLIASVYSFFNTFLNLVLINQQNGR